MANTGRDSNGSQWFVTYQATPWLNGIHTVFGEMVNTDEINSEETLTLLELGGSISGIPTSNFVISGCGVLE